MTLMVIFGAISADRGIIQRVPKYVLEKHYPYLQGKYPSCISPIDVGAVNPQSSLLSSHDYSSQILRELASCTTLPLLHSLKTLIASLASNNNQTKFLHEYLACLEGILHLKEIVTRIKPGTNSIHLRTISESTMKRVWQLRRYAFDTSSSSTLIHNCLEEIRGMCTFGWVVGFGGDERGEVSMGFDGVKYEMRDLVLHNSEFLKMYVCIRA